MTKEALERIREDYEKQVFDLKQLLEISKSLNSTLEYNILIDSILYTIMGQMRVLKAGLFAKKGLDTSSFVLHRNYKGFEIVRRREYAIPDDHEMIKLFAKAYRCYTLTEIKEHVSSLNGLEGFLSLDPALVVPLRAKGGINGIIILSERIEGSDFSEYEKEYILNIAILAGIAINNAFLFEMTTTDMMTKLKMKHYFYQVLLEKMEYAEENKRALSVIMLDIDHFKIFNDTYGHSCGDQVLKHVAKTIHDGIRSIDLAARYGGEEFCVLLPDTDSEHAMAIAERIRTSVMDGKTTYEGQKLGVTISLGVASFDPLRDVSGKMLIDRADKALYHSKQNGRNRTSIAE